MTKSAPLIIVRGAGDLASGVLAAIRISGFQVLALETENPSAIRRSVAFSEAVRLGSCSVEGIDACLIEKETAIRIFMPDTGSLYKAPMVTDVMYANEVPLHRMVIPVAVDPLGELIPILRPAAVVDAIIAKKNCGTHIGMAPLVIALGPGFIAGKDVHIVIETMRGHNLGRLIYTGEAVPNTGVPGLIGGESTLRVIHAPASGVLQVFKDIGSEVQRGNLIARVVRQDGTTADICAPMSGLIRGMLPDLFPIRIGMKTADIDPRVFEKVNCTTISDKARALGGAVLTALLSRGIFPVNIPA